MGVLKIDFSKHKIGDVIDVFCCNDCCISRGKQPKSQPDSGNKSWYCELCNHYNIGSYMRAEITSLLIIKLIHPGPDYIKALNYDTK